MKIPIPEFLDDLQRKISSGRIATKYSHDTEIDHRKIHTDCSGFLDWVLNNTGRDRAVREIHEHKLSNLKPRQNPEKLFVRNFVHALETSDFTSWIILNGPEDLRDGDIIFSTNMPAAANTNHCMIVRKREKLPDGKFKITIMDSSLECIHFNDTRTAPGVGTGEVFIKKTLHPQIHLCDYSDAQKKLRKKLIFARAI